MKETDNQPAQNPSDILRDTFNIASEHYDKREMRFFDRSAELLVALLNLKGNEQVLDIATGTGNIALRIAQRLNTGKVIGIDFSNGMLDQAKKKAARLGISNAEFIEMDMQALNYPPRHFDIAVCSYGVFFVEDMEGLLADIAAKVKPGGTVIISTFSKDAFVPLADLFYDRLRQYGLEIPPPRSRRVADRAACEALFQKAGLAEIRVIEKDLSQNLGTAEVWWQTILGGGMRAYLKPLSPDQLARFREEHLAEVASLASPGGIKLTIATLLTQGVIPP